jgi:hypothetical protein
MRNQPIYKPGIRQFYQPIDLLVLWTWTSQTPELWGINNWLSHPVHSTFCYSSLNRSRKSSMLGYVCVFKKEGEEQVRAEERRDSIALWGLLYFLFLGVSPSSMSMPQCLFPVSCWVQSAVSQDLQDRLRCPQLQRHQHMPHSSYLRVPCSRPNSRASFSDSHFFSFPRRS